MRLISRKRLRLFWGRCRDAEQPLRAWCAEAEKANWGGPKDIRARFAAASFVGDRVVFNICGNKYRLVVAVRYAAKIVFVRFVGTHAEYDEIDVRTV